MDNDTWDRLVEVHSDIISKNQYETCVRIIDETILPIEPGEASESLFVIQAMMLALSAEFGNTEPVSVTGINDKATRDFAREVMIVSGIEPTEKLDREFINTLSELYMAYITKNNVKNNK